MMHVSMSEKGKGIVQTYGDGGVGAMVAGNVGEVGDDRIDHGDSGSNW